MTEVEGQVRVEELDAEREARRQLALAQIRQYPDPVLRMEAKPVEEFDDDLLRLVERMSTLMIEARGVGLAATQVGILRRLFVFSPAEEEVKAIVNPETVLSTPFGIAGKDKTLLRMGLGQIQNDGRPLTVLHPA